MLAPGPVCDLLAVGVEDRRDRVLVTDIGTDCVEVFACGLGGDDAVAGVVGLEFKDEEFRHDVRTQVRVAKMKGGVSEKATWL